MCLITQLLFILLFLIFAFWAYTRITCGICKSSRHLVGKVVIVTGANAGIGFETAKNLAERGARVIMACRNEGRATVARDEIIAATSNLDVHYRHLDLASLKSVREFADNINNTEERVDILINNAAIYGSKLEKTEDGLLLGMQSNHFGPFLLTCLLLPKLKSSAPSRIINVSSIAHEKGIIDFDNLNGEKEMDETIHESKVYALSKLCNILMTVELARQLQGIGVTVNCLHPGVVVTEILNYVPVIGHLLPILKYFFKDTWEGAQTSVYLAVAPEVASVSGRYFKDCREVKPSKSAQDVYVARKLWEVSEKIVKLK
ncbi:retinol dehydrogenase 13-like [Leguminivora glycinivorella]|uniref:retinol dehydrogenase 13-like n=1 Tax=Leguminivora glycinivorella TaxID=1035111 RepID=UPI00200CE794|nr:retinol dehydrogenase 13-like [Leguminivora glycinivorella]